MKKFAMAGLVLAVCTAAPAEAQVTLDVGKITCGQFVSYKVTNPKYISVWLSGFYHGKRNSTVIELQNVKDNAKNVRSFCLQSSNRKMLLVDAAARVAGKSQ